MSVFKHQTHRSELKNTTEMKKADVAQKETDAVSATEKAVEKRDVEKIRNELAE